jgi:hypothetical protein
MISTNYMRHRVWFTRDRRVRHPITSPSDVSNKLSDNKPVRKYKLIDIVEEYAPHSIISNVSGDK